MVIRPVYGHAIDRVMDFEIVTAMLDHHDIVAPLLDFGPKFRDRVPNAVPSLRAEWDRKQRNRYPITHI